MPSAASFESFAEELSRLVASFAQRLAELKQPGYAEAQLRDDFLNPFFRALGWDMENRAGLIQAHREVVIEWRTDSGRADYFFRTDRRARFVCEAKKPAEELPPHAHQAKSYAWTIGVPLAALTDFEELNIYIVGSEPKEDEPLVGLWRTYHFRDYPAKARELWDLLARDSVAGGVIERTVEALPKKPLKIGKGQFVIRPDPTKNFDNTFLTLLDNQRRSLASDLLRHNEDEDWAGTRLNEAVQCILDRLLFIRISEARGIDMGTKLLSLLEIWQKKQKSGGGAMHEEPPAGWGAAGLTAPRGSLWHSIVQHIRALDRRPPSHVPYYNGNLFKPHFSEEIVVGDEWLEAFLEKICNEFASYKFGYVAVEILGTIYERFLGKVVRAHGRGAVIEEKPEVRKAGGVYYTPEYIVRYIVERTVGRSVAGKSPAQIERLRFADIACGSGSFLLGVFDCLLRHHTAWYNDPANARRAKADGCLATEDGAWRLSLQQRRAILVNNVYGVDLDAQAVEVAQLSLYLKLLEDETTASARGYQLEFHETLLPSLAKNIVAGNSLIGTDILLQSDLAFTPREERKLGAMDFARAFPEVFRDAENEGRVCEQGWQVDVDFDPPRTPVRYDKPKAKKSAKTLPEKMPAHAGGFDAIVGNPPYGALTGPRETQYLRAHYQCVANSMDTFLMFMERAASLLRRDGALGYIIPSGWVSTPSSRKLRRIFAEQFRPESFVSLPYDVFAGAYIDTIIVTARKTVPAIPWKQLSDPSIRLVVFPIRYKVTEQEDFTRFEKTGDLSRWMTNEDSEFLVTSSTVELALIEKIRRTPHTCETFVDVMRGIEKFHPRARAGMRNPVAALTGDIHRYLLTPGAPAFEDYPAEIAAAKPARFFTGPRILLRQLLSRKFRLQAIYTTDPFLTNQSVQSLVARQENQLTDLRSVLAVLNSRLISWYFCEINMVARRDDFPKTIIKQTRELPFPNLAGQRIIHDRLVLLADHLLAAKKQEAVSPTEADREYFARKGDGLDAQIDALIYELYGLTPPEIALVEGRA